MKPHAEQIIMLGVALLSQVSCILGGQANQAPAIIDAAKYADLQAAFNALPPEGGKVILPPGDFELTEPLRLARENVFIEGAGPATHIINKNTNRAPAIIVAAGDQTAGTKKRLWRVQLGNFRISGNPASGEGIYAEGVDEIFVHGVTVDHNGGHGLNLIDCYENPRVVHCNITYNGGAGLNLVNCHDIVVSGNQFEENLDAVRCLDSYNLTMTGNNLDDHVRHGVIVENTYGSVLSGNMIEECNGTAIVIDRDCYGITFSANVIAHNLSGIDLRGAWGCTVSANTFTLIHTNSIIIRPKSGRITITGNTFCNSYVGHSNRRPDSSDDPMGRDAGSGVLLDGTTDIVISGNTFSGLEDQAVRAINRCRRLIISNNLVVDCNRKGDKTVPLIDTGDANQCQISGNLLWGHVAQ